MPGEQSELQAERRRIADLIRYWFRGDDTMCQVLHQLAGDIESGVRRPPPMKIKYVGDE